MGALHRLSDKAARAAGPGRHADGGGLYLQVRKVDDSDGRLRRSWIFRYATGEVVTSAAGKLRRVERELGLGAYPDISLAEARERALDARRKRAADVDPIEACRAAETEKRRGTVRAVTFKQCADAFIKAHRASWRNPKHAAQWESTLETYAEPLIGALQVAAIDTALVMMVLEQEVGEAEEKQALWTAKPETASRLRGRMEQILDWARVREYRQGENPARWRGHLDKLLPKVAKTKKVQRERMGRDEHHAALPYQDMQAFMILLREREATSARALEFTILTAARTGETIGARWDEIDLANKIWTVPPERMKPGRKHRVPLSSAAMAIIEEMQNIRQSNYLFPGEGREQLSNMAFLMLLRRMKRDDLTVHGFRATFKTWAEEVTSFPREMIEVALSHGAGKLEEAYNRGDLFEKRHLLMSEWARFCGRPE